MSNDASPAGFGKFVPGFDFLQSLAKGAAQSMPQMPGLGGWVAPTLSVEDLEKRISELKAVQFWLDQNAMALKATIQALEVQKMTLATLKGMNVSMAEVAKAFTAQRSEDAAAAPVAPAPAPSPAPEPEPAAEAGAADAAGARPGVIDAMQWWGALTQQFQQIAATAMKDAAARAAPEAAAASAPARKRAATGTPAAAPAAKPPAKAAPRKRAR
ncbi:PhaM family polyhydroxyalkanoate granule multifunctional regulatory protein [Pseudorhodoferax sp.]|uniref:PhaM family polyhydroxyalkanoate granule multifunctional regulatory protein n=1 Tax=Pseudorhodoferax sp. TaxID=1993553 RepID=UPI002DD68C77|nr:PhaM family polyhydroxyalkanoate granule multifunctional regulatory protein [Pseudorhodoferax sp.]